MSRPSKKLRSQGLYPDEAEIARRLSQTPSDWAALAPILEREGLPAIDPLMGGRCWLAVVAYLLSRYRMSTVELSIVDGTENLNALK